MRRKLCCLMSVVLALGICLPGGAVQAIAEEGDAAPEPIAQESSEETAPDQHDAEGGEASAGEGEKPATADGGVEAAPTGDDETAAGETGADGTRAGLEEASDEALTAETEDDASDKEETARSASKRTRGSPKEVPATVTNLTIQTLSGNTTNEMWVTDWFYLAMNWDASQNGADLHEGDYFDIILPNQMMFPSDSSAVDFNIYGDDGVTVIATAHVTPGPGNKGGSVRVTFTDWVEGKENVKGNIRLSAKFDQTQVTVGQPSTFQIQVGSQVVPVTVNVTGPTELQNEILSKWGQGVEEGGQPVPDVAEWHIRINHMEATLTNVVITDHLSGGAGGETYIPGSFVLRRVTMSPTGGVLQVHETDNTADLSGRLTIAADGSSFTLNLGNIDGDQYRLSYRTTYTPGTKLRNNMTLTSVEQTKTYSGSHQAASSGGQGTGDLANKIKIVKVDAEDNSTPLAGVVFEVERPNGTTFELTTGADSTVTSGTLTSGTYKVREKTPLTGYVADNTVHTLVVSSEAGAVLTVSNEPIRTSVSVTKEWVGPEGGSVTVHLLADGEDVGQTLELSAANGWTGSFDNLRQYKPDGTEIFYTIEELDIENYSSEITGDAADGFTVTNTNTETIDIPVEKKWTGPEGTEVTVVLLADGTDTGKTLTLNEANGWTDAFVGLPVYDETTGEAIAYTIEELDIENYSSEITGDAADGFIVTNTNTETVDVSGAKTWDDGDDRDGKRPESITVNLLADGAKIDETEVDADDGWAWAFSGLPKYDSVDGHEIVYTVTEDAIPDYETTIDGYDITNSYAPGKTSLTVSKAWDDANDQDGLRADSVQVQLYANGTPSGSPVTLNAKNKWTHTWTGLFQKDAGKDIEYTVAEVKTPGGYTATITGNAVKGFTVTNVHTPETVSIPVTKKWIGGEGGPVTIHLLAGGVDTGQQLTLSKDGNWTGSFTDLPKYAGGKEIAYTVSEDAVKGYSSKVTGDAANGFTVTNTKGGTPGKPTSGKSGLGSFAPKTGDGTGPLLMGAALLALASAAFGARALLARRRSRG